MYPSITYTAPDYNTKPGKPDNCDEVYQFIGPQPECPLCGGYGEYEGEHGPVGCNACCSRLIFFTDYRGKRVGADWGDTITREPDGLHIANPKASD